MCGSVSKWPDPRPWPRRARREPELWEHLLCNRHLNHACSNVNYVGSLNPYKNPGRGPSVLFCISGEIGSERLRNTSKITQLARCRDRLQVHILYVGGGPKPPNAMCSLHYPCLLSRRPEAHFFPEDWEQVARCLPAGPGPEWSPWDSDALTLDKSFDCSGPQFPVWHSPFHCRTVHIR